MAESKNVQLEELGEEEKQPAGDRAVTDRSAMDGMGDGGGPASSKDLEAVYDIPVQVSAVLGKATMQVSQLLKLGRGAVVELEQKTSDPVEIFANEVLIARGEVVITSGDKIGVTLTELVKSIYNQGD